MTTTRRPAPTREDRAQFELWCRAQAARVQDYLRIDIWNGAALTRKGKAVPDDVDAWRGPWFAVKPYVTTEFREGVEDGTIPRPTLTEWAADAHRAREAEREHMAVSAGAHAMESLAYLADLMTRRGQMIADARRSGESWESICAASGLSRSQASKILADHETAERLAAIASDDGEPF